MEVRYVIKLISQMDGMRKAMEYAFIQDGGTPREDQARDLLSDARLKLIEDLDERSPGWELAPGVGLTIDSTHMTDEPEFRAFSSLREQDNR